MADKVRVLFVCLGNICRSPTAEAVMRAKVREEGLEDRFEIASSGLGTWNLGEPPHPKSRAILDAKGIPYDGMRAKVLRTQQMNQFDYIVAMDRENLAELRRRGVDMRKVYLLTDFIPGKEGEEVPDPYYYGNFEGVFDLIEQGVHGLLRTIKEQYGWTRPAAEREPRHGGS